MELNEMEPRSSRNLSPEELVEEFQSGVWADAINEAEEMSPRTLALKEEILRRMQLRRPDWLC